MSPRLPYPTTELLPVDALRALRSHGFRKATAEQIASPSTWATLVAVWNSKRNAEARTAYDVDSWAALVWSLNATVTCDVATRKADPSTLAWLTRLYQCVGVARSAEQETKFQKRKCRESRSVDAAKVVATTGRRHDCYKVDVDAAAFLGDLLADNGVGYVVIGNEGELVAFDRVRLSKVAAAVKAFGNVRVSYDGSPSERKLCVRWGGRGGLNLRPDFENPAEWRESATVDVVFPWGDPALPAAYEAAPVAAPQGVQAEPESAPALVVEPVAKDAPAVKVAAAPVKPAATDGLSPTQRKWIEFKAIRPAVEELDARLASGQFVCPEAASFLADARACKRTSWGSVLGKWKLALAAARVAA